MLLEQTLALGPLTCASDTRNFEFLTRPITPLAIPMFFAANAVPAVAILTESVVPSIACQLLIVDTILPYLLVMAFLCHLIS